MSLHPTPNTRSTLPLAILPGFLLGLLALSPPSPAQGTTEDRAPAETAHIAFTGAHVLPMDGDRVLEAHTVLVRGDRILAVGPDGTILIPEGTRRIEAEGGWLLPGLAEMHGHLPSPQVQAGTPEDVLFLYLAHGITTVRGMLGQPDQLEMRDAIEAGELLGPRLFVGSPPLTGGSARDPESAEALVRQYHGLGYDHLKVHEGLSPDTYRRIAETAHELGLHFGGHVADAVGLRVALAEGQATIDHLDNVLEAVVELKTPDAPPTQLAPAAVVQGFDEDRLAEVVAILHREGAAVVPTEALWGSIFGSTPLKELREQHPEIRYMPKPLIQSWHQQIQGYRSFFAQNGTGDRILELRKTALAAIHRAGIPILLGTDSPQIYSVPGFSMHREMEHMVAAGMTPYEVLVSGTRNVAEFYGEEGHSGIVAPGARADLILVQGDPRQDLAALRDPRGVMHAGRWLDSEAIEVGLARIEAKYR